MSPNVFIMVKSKNILSPFKTVSAYDYQQEALDDYIDNNIQVPKKYNPNNSTLIFYINKFDSSNFNGDYSDFYIFVKEDESVYILSRNESKLRTFCSYINRLLSY